MSYTVDPGLYAAGDPDGESMVLASCNYKLSFDLLRRELAGRNLWVLVLDTRGINVWCSSGKGTFGTQELVDRIASTGLAGIVTHRKLILPQLSGPGVAAHEVKKLSGFRVVYGPIRAEDLPAFLDAKLKATPEMRRKTFTLGERAVLVPVELAAALKAALFIVPLLLLLGGWGGAGAFRSALYNHGLFAAAAFLAAVAAGAVAAPILLPWLPGRAFALKGVSSGVAAALLYLYPWVGKGSSWPGILEMAGWGLLMVALSSYLAMNFTGASTYTSLSGVKREMRMAVPLQIVAGSAGMLAWFFSLFLSRRMGL